MDDVWAEEGPVCIFRGRVVQRCINTIRNSLQYIP